jgi:hypothetical protein
MGSPSLAGEFRAQERRHVVDDGDDTPAALGIVDCVGPFGQGLRWVNTSHRGQKTLGRVNENFAPLPGFQEFDSRSWLDAEFSLRLECLIVFDGLVLRAFLGRQRVVACGHTEVVVVALLRVVAGTALLEYRSAQPGYRVPVMEDLIGSDGARFEFNSMQAWRRAGLRSFPEQPPAE